MNLILAKVIISKLIDIITHFVRVIPLHFSGTKKEYLVIE